MWFVREKLLAIILLVALDTFKGTISATTIPAQDSCPNKEIWCDSLTPNEKLSLEAISILHRQLDDDKDGIIDLEESDEFLREELKYEKDYEKRQKAFHRNNDNQVSVKELWETWVKSEVHNWTVEQTVEWLIVFVGLPQYQNEFSLNLINGTHLPRLAANQHHYLTSLGIKDAIHKQKISLKAQDVVLFGPSRDPGSFLKDLIYSTVLILALSICWFSYHRNKEYQKEVIRMTKHMETLTMAEQTLEDIKKELANEKAKTDQIQTKPILDRAPSDDSNSDPSEINYLRDQVAVLRNELQRTELELQDKCWVPPPALQHWLQLTYELELKSYKKKNASAERQLKQAKDACDKLKRKRSSLIGAFVSTHGRSIDDVDKAILEARTALTEVTQELQERTHRWKQIEMLANCSIMNNPGMGNLEHILRTYGKSSFGGPGSVISNSQDDLIDDDGASSIYCPSTVHKLVSTSTYLMYPGHQPPAVFPFSAPSRPSSAATFQPPSSASELQSINSGLWGMGNSLGHYNVGHEKEMRNSTITHSQTCQCFSCIEKLPEDSVSSSQLPIMRSKSVSSMLSLKAGRETKDFNDEEMEGSESGNGRKVTFRAEHRNGKVKSFPIDNGNSMELHEIESRREKILDDFSIEEVEKEIKKGNDKVEPDLIKEPSEKMKKKNSPNLQTLNEEVVKATEETMEDHFGDKSGIWKKISKVVRHGSLRRGKKDVGKSNKVEEESLTATPNEYKSSRMSLRTLFNGSRVSLRIKNHRD